MALFIDTNTQKVLHKHVRQADDHMFQVGIKIEITDTDEKTVSQYRITDIILPYTFSRGIFGGLSDIGQEPKIFLELVSTRKAS